MAVLAPLYVLDPPPTAGELPARFPSPFDPGPPHPLARRAADALLARLRRGEVPGEAALHAAGEGKMFGVLVVADAAGRVGWLAGFSGTATVQAGRLYDIPLYGTMAHSYVQAFGDEMMAFEHFVRSQPDNAVLLIDTYDTERAAGRVVELAARLGGEGLSIKGVRIDSGDLGALARKVRATLDRGGFPDITIFASGNLDEFRLRELVESEAPIDGFGIGTRMNTSADRPYLDSAYKLQEYDGEARRKRSAEKATWPGRKQVWRRRDASGLLAGDTLGLATDDTEGEPLLVPVMRAGRRLAPPDTLAAALLDSPAGLAAWLVEKYRTWGDCEGNVETRFSKDTLLTIISLYLSLIHI